MLFFGWPSCRSKTFSLTFIFALAGAQWGFVWCWLFIFMIFHHWASVSEWLGEPAWPSLCWRYSATSAGNLCDSSPSSSSTWPPGASFFCTLASSGTTVLEPEEAETLLLLRKWAAGLHRTLGDLASWVGCLRKNGEVDGGSVPLGWRKLDRRALGWWAGGETTPATGTARWKDAMPKTWMMEEVGENRCCSCALFFSWGVFQINHLSHNL